MIDERCPPRLRPIHGERPNATTEFGTNNKRKIMNNPLDMTQGDIERFNQWHAEHSISIPVNESYLVAVGITVQSIGDDSRIRMAVDHIDATTGRWSEKACAYLTPEEARRLSDLLLAVVAEGAPK